MNIYLEIVEQSIVSGFVSIITAIASVVLLYASQLITTGDGDCYLPGMGYRFNSVNYKGAFVMGGVYAFIFMHMYPLIFLNAPIVNWVPVLMISLLVAQSVIDLKYHELTNEWSFIIGLLAMYWSYMNGTLSFINLYIAMALLVLSFISWVFTGLPGLGDVKLLFVGGILLNNWISAYHFALIIMILSLTFVSLHALVNQVPPNKWWRLNFPMGPYIAIGIIAALVGVI